MSRTSRTINDVRRLAKSGGIMVHWGGSNELPTSEQWKYFQTLMKQDGESEGKYDGEPCYSMRAICMARRPSVTSFTIYQEKWTEPFYVWLNYGNVAYRFMETKAEDEELKVTLDWENLRRVYYPVAGYAAEDPESGIAVRAVTCGILRGKRSLDVIVDPDVWDRMVAPLEYMENVGKAQLTAKHCLRGTDVGRERSLPVLDYVRKVGTCFRETNCIPTGNGMPLRECHIQAMQRAEPNLPVGWAYHFLRGMASVLEKIPEQSDPEKAAERLAELFNRAGSDPKWSTSELLEISRKKF